MKLKTGADKISDTIVKNLLDRASNFEGVGDAIAKLDDETRETFELALKNTVHFVLTNPYFFEDC